jgi:cytochrome c550
MKRNPVIPYAIIAVLGIVAMIIFASVGVSQMNEAEDAEGNKTEENGNGDVQAAEPDQIYSQNCSSCHGADLSGGFGPSLQTIGNTYTADDIKGFILNGKGNMPPVAIAPEQATAVAEWLAEKK